MIDGMVVEVRRRPLNDWVISVVLFIVEPALESVENGCVDVFWCVECFECFFQMGKGTAACVADSFILATDDVVLVFVVGGGQ